MDGDGSRDGDGADDGSPFAGPFGDEFVAGATRQEASADERIERMRRIDAEFRRLVDERRGQLQVAEARPGRTRLRRNVVCPLLALAIAGAAVWWSSTGGLDDVLTAVRPPEAAAPPGWERPVSGTDGAPSTTTADADAPPAEAGDQAPPTPEPPRQDDPLGTPAPVVVESAAHTFSVMQADSSGPVAYDPCRAIRVVVNERAAPAGSDGIVAEALAEIGRATGLVFEVEGPTAEPPGDDRQPRQPDRYGDRWAPVLVAWSDPVESPALAGDVAGTGGSTWVGAAPNRAVFVTGAVSLDGPQLGEQLSRPDVRSSVRAVVMHELAHVVGLDHVDDPAELMYPSSQPGVVAFGSGDLTGLARLGRGECFPDL